jgi:hypothetical protein
MRGSTVLRVVAGIALVVLLAGLGVAVFEAGVAQGVADAGRVPAGAVVPYGRWGYGFHGFGFGFGLFGIVWFLLFVLLLIGLFRFAFGGRRRWGGPGGDARGGFGRGWYGHAGPEGPDGGAWGDERRRRLAELHRQLHEESGSPGGSSGPQPGSGGGSTTPAGH